MATLIENINLAISDFDNIRLAIENKGIIIPNTTPTNMYAAKIDSIPSGGEDEFVPIPEWWDIETIIKNDTRVYTSKVIELLSVGDITTSLSGASAYYTSDGKFYATSSQSHTWDRSKDKICTEVGMMPYKTRYVIKYYTSEEITLNISLSCLYFIVKFGKFKGSGIGSTSIMSSPVMLRSFKLLDGANLSKSVTMISNLFRFCYSMTHIPVIDTSQVTYAMSAFSNCASLMQIPKINTSKMVNMSYMFQNCVSLTDVEIDCSSCDTTTYMFAMCASLRRVNIINGKLITNAISMFANCSSLYGTTFESSILAAVNSAFSGCYTITTIGVIDVSEIATAGNSNSIFDSCFSLQDVKLKGLRYSLTMTWSTELSVETMDYIITNAQNLVGFTSQNLTLGSTNLAKLPVAIKNKATAKNWTLS